MLSDAWEAEAEDWVRWARAPGHDSYWTFHRDAFLALLPGPGRLTVDVGCGEGRLTRDLAALGHRVVGLDRSRTLVRYAAAAGGTVGSVLVAVTHPVNTGQRSTAPTGPAGSSRPARTGLRGAPAMPWSGTDSG